MAIYLEERSLVASKHYVYTQSSVKTMLTSTPHFMDIYGLDYASFYYELAKYRIFQKHLRRKKIINFVELDFIE